MGRCVVSAVLVVEVVEVVGRAVYDFRLLEMTAISWSGALMTYSSW